MAPDTNLADRLRAQPWRQLWVHRFRPRRLAAGIRPGLLIVAFGLLVLLSLPAPAAAARYSAIVVDAGTGEVLFARSADSRRYPASLTKMMTLYLTFEALEAGTLKIDQALPVSRRAAGQTPSKLGLAEGTRITVRDAMLAVVTKSANDAATVLAEAIAGTEVKFAQSMTQRATALGMIQTRFTNASGLPNRRQRTTARDMATLALSLMSDFPAYYGLFSTREFTFAGRTFENHNNLLDTYEGADGLKTGYIRASGFNLVASAERDGRRLVGVVFGGRSTATRDHHLTDLFDKAFAAPPSTLAILIPIPKPGRTAVAVAAVEPAPTLRPAPTVAEAVPEIPPAPRRPATEIPAPVVAEIVPVPTPQRPVTAVPAVAKVAPVPAPRPVIPTRLAGLAGEETRDRLALATLARQQAEDTFERNLWAVQVGAFERKAAAWLEIARAGRIQPALLFGTDSLISEIVSGGRTLYRARLVGLTEDRARDACRVLSQERIDCVALPVSQGDAPTD